MFEEVLSIIELLKTFIYYGFYYSFIIGQLLVEIVKEVLQIWIIIMKTLTGVYFTLSESFDLFFRDIEQFNQVAFRFLSNSYQEAGNSLSRTTQMLNNSIEEVVLFISMTYSFLSYGIYTTIATIGEVFLFCKQAVILFGTSVWFVLTFIPFSIWNMVLRTSRFLEELHKMALDLEAVSLRGFKNIFVFLTDMPVESVIGLLAAACIGYALNQFCLTFFSVFYQELTGTILNIYEKFKRVIVTAQSPILRQRLEPIQNPVAIQPPVPIQYRATQPSMMTLRKRPLIRERNPSPISKNTASEDLYCVICQEHLKCILLLPCRHVCMCSECNSRLQLYTDICPICRIHIASTMQIYL